MIINGKEVTYTYWVQFIITLDVDYIPTIKRETMLTVKTQTAVEDELEEMLIDRFGEDYVGIVDFELIEDNENENV